MLNGVGPSESLAVSLAGAAALVAALLVYRDARRHGSYHALSATGAVAIAGAVGYAVGSVVGLFVAVGYMLLLYVLSYPTTPTVDPDGRPRADAGESIASEADDDVVSVIRVEVASDETLRELAGRYDDVPNDGTEAELRSALRVKALSEVREEVDGEPTGIPPSSKQLTDPDAPADRASEYGIEEWVGDVEASPTERTGEYGAADWSSEEPPAETERDYGADDWTTEASPTTDGQTATTTSATGNADAEASTAGAGIWETAGTETEQPEQGGEMVFDNAIEEPPERTTEAETTVDTDRSADSQQAADAPQAGAQERWEAEATDDGDPFDGRGELYDGDGRGPAANQT